jgi:chromosome segregation ATPase
MRGDQAPPPATTPTPSVHLTGTTRWLGGEGFADITKLRELAAKHERLAAKIQARIARLHTKIEKLRHQSTLLREKAAKVLERIPEYQQEMTQHERTIQASTSQHTTHAVGSDITSLHYRIRQLQQKIVDIQHSARRIEHKAAVKTQQSAVLKVKADRLTDQVRANQIEAQNYQKRADRLQLATETDAAQYAAAPLPPPPPPPPPPSNSPNPDETPGEHDQL